MENDLDIYVCTYKDFNKVVNDETYKVINVRDIDQSKYPLTDRFFSELVSYFHIAETAELKKYIGFCHYRKYFDFMDNIPDMDEIFKTSDVILTKPLKFYSSIKRQYGVCHNPDDLALMQEIINDKFPEYADACENVLNNTFQFYSCNMFIMKKEDFLEYIDFMKGVLFEFVDRIGTDIYKRIDEHKDKYLKKVPGCPQNMQPWYQYRIGGYLGERLTNVFIAKKFKNIKTYGLVVTEEKYKKGITDKDD